MANPALLESANKIFWNLYGEDIIKKPKLPF